MRIGLFDSGVGGLSIYRHLKHLLPEAKFTYCLDWANFPYGTKSDEKLIDITSQVACTLTQTYQLDILVVACNTASTIALPAIRQIIDIPVVGVVPAIKPAAKLSQNKIIGLLATPGTVNRPYTDDLIAEFAANCEVIRVGSVELVKMAEDKLLGVDPNEDDLVTVLRPFFMESGSCDVIVLGCTHFPLLVDELRKVASKLNHEVQWLDSSAAIGRRVSQLLQAGSYGQKARSPLNGTAAAHQLVCTSNLRQSELAHLCQTFGFDKVEYLDLTKNS